MSSHTISAEVKRKLVWTYYAFQFFFTLLIWTPVFFEFHKRVGMSDSEIYGIQSWYYVFFCFLEIPTGFFADRFGYLRSMKLGAGVLIVSNLLPIFFPTYSGLLIHWLLIATARSFISGASVAYLYEFLRQYGLTEEFKKIEGNARAVSLYGRVACFAVVGYIMKWNLYAPYWITVVSASISLVYAYRLPILQFQAGSRLENRKVSLPVAFQELFQTPKLIFLIFQGVVLFVLARIVMVNLYQPILESKSFGLGMYGVILAVMTLIEAIGSANPGWMRKFFSDFTSVFVLSLVMGISTMLIPVFGASMTIILLAVFSLATGFSYPIQKQLMNDAIPDPKYRATLLSLESIVDRAFSAGVALILEKVAVDKTPITTYVMNTFFDEMKPMDQFIVWAGLASCALMLILWGVPVLKKLSIARNRPER